MSDEGLERRILGVADRLRKAKRIVVLTGAGASAESGVPTFRDAMTGLWAQYDPHRLATPEAFAADPELVTRWYDWRRGLIAGCEPNAGHRAVVELAAWAEGRGASVCVLTQNVDGLHQRAGSRDVVELHGSIHVWRCTLSGEERRDLPLPLASYPVRTERGGYLRPGVVWFGEALPEAALERAVREAGSCDVLLSVGTSGIVYPAAGLPRTAGEAGAYTVEINRERTPLSGWMDAVLLGASGEVLPRIVGAVRSGG